MRVLMEILIAIVGFAIGYAMAKDHYKPITDYEKVISEKDIIIKGLQNELSRKSDDAALTLRISEAEYQNYLDGLERIQDTLVDMNEESNISRCRMIQDIILQEDTSVPCKGDILTLTIRDILEEHEV